MYILGILLAIAINTSEYQYKNQDKACLKLYENKNCKPEHAEGFKRTALSRNCNLEVGQTVRFEVVLYGGVEIIIKCCTEEEFYPIRFKLIKSETGKIIYDNKYNDYIDNLNLLLDYTESLAVEISIDPKNKILKKLKENNACISMSVYMENSL